MADPVNRALSAANSCLYGLVHAAILSGGYSPALGFIHTGKQLSFVYDVADLYKMEMTVLLAFSIAAAEVGGIERKVRLACRDRFSAERLVERVLPDIRKVLKVEAAEQQAPDEFAAGGAMPADWWQPATIAAELPIGQILKMDDLSSLSSRERDSDDNSDPGEGDSVTAG